MKAATSVYLEILENGNPQALRHEKAVAGLRKSLGLFKKGLVWVLGLGV